MKQLHSFCLVILIVGQSIFGQDSDDAILHPACFKDLGCFQNLSNRTDLLPQHPEECKLIFKLFTNENFNVSIDFAYDFRADQIINSTFVYHKRVIFIIGGVNSSFQKDGWNGKLKNTILDGKPHEFNVFSVNWLNTAMRMKYQRAMSNVEVIGSALAAFIKRLVGFTQLKYSHIHLIGDGFGANIASYAGKKIYNPKISRITGLNPENPMSSETTLDPLDANYVDILYTDYRESGYSAPIGFINFYIYGGASQAACSKTRGITETMTCDHQFSHRLLNVMPEDLPEKCQFVGVQCSSYDNFKMGFCQDCGARNEKCFLVSLFGINEPELRLFYKKQFKNREVGKKYYFETLDEPPFCLYHYGLSIYFASSFSGSIAVEVYGLLSQRNFTLESSADSGMIQALMTSKNGLGQLDKVIVKSLEPNHTIQIHLFFINFLSNMDPGVRDEWSALMVPDTSKSSQTQITLVPYL